jgi:hypothetical protein
MAVSTIAKSVMRNNDNIIVGYGEVPAVRVNGVTGWGLPGGIVTFREREAREYAAKLDAEIRRTMKSPAQLISAS